MSLHNSSNSHGIALVEVLITTVVTAVGILAVILLLNSLKTSSSISKARDEALSLAQSKIELFQNTINKAQYQAIKSGEERAIKGLNSVYLRRWEVIDKKKPARKLVNIIVSWKDNKAKPEFVQLNTIINWNDPLKSASIASYGIASGFAYLSPNQFAVKGDQKEVNLPKDIKTESMPYQMKKYTDSQANTLVLDENNHLLLTILPHDGKARELLSLSGQIYYQGNSQIDMNVLVSQGAYCLFPLESKNINNSIWTVAKYYCVVAKNWQGKIGILTSQNDHNLSYCPRRNREYLGYSLINNKKLYQSGISNSYSNQDFVVENMANNNFLSCNERILQIQNLLDKNSLKLQIKAENYTLMEVDNVFSLSGKIKLPDKVAKYRLLISIADRKHDCRILNHLDHYNDAYSCVVETKNPGEAKWKGKITVDVFYDNATQASCHFDLDFENQYKAAILDLDLALLCR